MALTVIRGSSDKQAASLALTQALKDLDQLDGYLYIGYPILGSVEGKLAIDALLILRNVGLVIVDLIQGADPSNFSERQDDAVNKLEGKLRAYSSLVTGRKLRFSIHSVSYGPAIPVQQLSEDPMYPLCNNDTIGTTICSLASDNDAADVYDALLSALQNISSIRQNRTKRTVVNVASKGAKLKSLEDEIATLDRTQSEAVVETVDGVQRIRGLAGSGKTIVLALKAAYLHSQHPEWKIAVTFYTRSLKDQFKRLVNTFCLATTGEEPDYDFLRIAHAWGSPTDEDQGLYYEFCRTYGTTYYSYKSAEAKYGRTQAFEGVCDEAINDKRPGPPIYDAILVDEAQDMPPSFLKLCYLMLQKDKRLVYAYDELQNLAGQSVPPPEQIFGTGEDGNPLVSLDSGPTDGPKRDLILNVCYRNSKPVLTTAHALGFGIYRPSPSKETTGLVQMFDNPSLWTDIGYRINSGELAPGEQVELERTPSSSPLFLEAHSPVEDLIQFKVFRNQEEQCQQLVDDIITNLNDDELRHDDILVINPDPLRTEKYTGPIRQLLHDRGVKSHIAGVTTSRDTFFSSEGNSITFTGIYRAKGNEAGMVYIINAQDCHSANWSWNLASIRNRLFTAITRSKAWVRVYGVGDHMQQLCDEFQCVKLKNFILQFKYPTASEREKLAIIHRDVSPSKAKELKETMRSIQSLYERIRSGELHVQDLNEEQLEAIRWLAGHLEEL